MIKVVAGTIKISRGASMYIYLLVVRSKYGVIIIWEFKLGINATQRKSRLTGCEGGKDTYGSGFLEGRGWVEILYLNSFACKL